MNTDIKFKGCRDDNGEWINGYYLEVEYCDGKGRRSCIKTDGCSPSDIIANTVCQFTGYQMEGVDVYFDDLVSNNYGTDKEVIRQVILYEGIIMLKRVKGNSKLPKHIPLHDFHKLSYKVIGNIHDNKARG